MERQKNPFSNDKLNPYERVRPHWPQVFVHRVLGDILAPGANVVELGAGTGFLTRHLLSFPLRVWATDPSVDFAHRLKDACKQELVGFSLSDAINTVLPGDFSPAAIVSGNAHHWFADGPAAYSKLYEVWRQNLARNAFVVIYFLKIREDSDVAIAVDNILVDASQEYQHTRFRIINSESFSKYAFDPRDELQSKSINEAIEVSLFGFEEFELWLRSHSYFNDRIMHVSKAALKTFWDEYANDDELILQYRLFAYVGQL